MNAQMKFESVDQMIQEAEITLRKGMGSLSEWSELARDLLESKPAVILAAASVSGFVAGTILRHGFSMRRSVRTGRTSARGILPEVAKQELPIDPLLLLAGGLLAGVVVGPLLVERAFSSLSSLARNEEDILNFEDSRRHSANTMNEKPFEKF